MSSEFRRTRSKSMAFHPGPSSICSYLPSELPGNAAPIKTQRLLTALLLAMSVMASGCAAVAPWERGNLAKPHMALEPNPAERMLREHAYSSREAAIGGAAAAGGGCGCY